MSALMSTFVRWIRFNMVGAMGMAVQLTSLALLNHWTGGHYLFASAMAVEFALVHNFMWHRRFTWPDRRGSSAMVGQFVRFHLANGMVSLVGNVALMRVLVEEAHLPLLVANCIAILCCSIVNFCLGDLWAFAARRREAACRP